MKKDNKEDLSVFDGIIQMGENSSINDKENLIPVFKSKMEQVYNELCFYYGEENGTAIYNNLYRSLCISLMYHINSKTKREVYDIILSSTCIDLKTVGYSMFAEYAPLSKGDFNFIQKCIVANASNGNIMGNYVTREIDEKELYKRLHKECGTKRIHFLLEKRKAYAKVSKIRKEYDKKAKVMKLEIK